MAFGKRGVTATAGGGVQGGGVRVATPGYGEEIRFDHNSRSVASSLFLAVLGAGLLYYVPKHFVLDFRAYVLLGASFLLVIGFGGFLMNAMLGKARLVIDGQGFRTESIFGDKVMRWEDLDHFEIMSINYSKTVFACARKSAGRTLTKKMAVPTDIFKDKDLRFVSATLGARADLAPQLVYVMRKVGAKKLAGALIETA